MPLYTGPENTVKLFVGSDEVQKLYLGSIPVWEQTGGVVAEALGRTYVELWEGDLSGYNKSSTHKMRLVDDAAASAGRALQYWSSTAQGEQVYVGNNILDATPPTNAVAYVVLRTPPTVARFYIRFSDGNTNPNGGSAGVGFRRGALKHMQPGNGNVAGTTFGGYQSDTEYVVKIEVAGNTSRVSVWPLGEPEPTDPQSVRIHNEQIPCRTIKFGERVNVKGSNPMTVLSWSMGLNNDAPEPGITIPIATAIDPYEGAPATPKTSASNFDGLITFTIGGMSTTPMIGRYVDGSHFVLNPPGGSGLEVTSTPEARVKPLLDVEMRTGVTTLTDVNINGASVTEGQGSWGQGFLSIKPDSMHIKYSEVKNVGKEPFTAAPGDEYSYVKSAIQDEPAVGRSPMEAVAVLTVTKDAPPAHPFRPGIAEPSKAAPFSLADLIDLDNLPKFHLMGGDPSPLAERENLRWLSCCIWGSNSYSSYMSPDRNHPDGKYSVRSIGPSVNRAILMLCMDYSLDFKVDLAKCIVQRAIDAKAYLDNKPPGRPDYGGIDGTNGLGGVSHHGYKQSLLVASLLLGNDAGMRATGQKNRFVEDGQMGYVTQKIYDSSQTKEPYAGRPLAPYEPEDIGMPEWLSGNKYKSNVGNRASNAAYRQICVPYYVTTALCTYVFPGLADIWTSPQTLQYVDRVMERNFFKDPADPANIYQIARTYSGTDSLSSWETRMWDYHRTRAGNPPVWDWS